MKGWLKALHTSSGSSAATAISAEEQTQTHRIEPAGERERQSGRVRVVTSIAPPPAVAVSQVTLVVYGWNNAEPGTLAWVFPSLAAAMVAVRAMRNAVRWAILAGHRESEDVDVDGARANGLVLAEAL